MDSYVLLAQGKQAAVSSRRRDAKEIIKTKPEELTDARTWVGKREGPPLGNHSTK